LQDVNITRRHFRQAIKSYHYHSNQTRDRYSETSNANISIIIPIIRSWV